MKAEIELKHDEAVDTFKEDIDQLRQRESQLLEQIEELGDKEKQLEIDYSEKITQMRRMIEAMEESHKLEVTDLTQSYTQQSKANETQLIKVQKNLESIESELLLSNARVAEVEGELAQFSEESEILKKNTVKLTSDLESRIQILYRNDLEIDCLKKEIQTSIESQTSMAKNLEVAVAEKSLIQERLDQSLVEILQLSQKLAQASEALNSAELQHLHQKSANQILSSQVENLQLQFERELQQKKNFEKLYEEERSKKEELEIKYNAVRADLIHLDSAYKQLELESKQIVDDWTKERQKFLETNQRLDFVNKDRLKDIEKKSWENGKLLIKLAIAYAELERIAKFKRGDFSRRDSFFDADERLSQELILDDISECEKTDIDVSGDSVIPQIQSESKAQIGVNNGATPSNQPCDKLEKSITSNITGTLEIIGAPDSFVEAIQSNDVDVEKELKMVVESLDQEIMQMIGKVEAVTGSKVSEI